MRIWLLESGVAADLRAARDAGRFPTHEQQAAYEATHRAAVEARDGMPRNLTVAGDVAEIRVEGVLTERLDFFAFLFGNGNTTYQSIRDSLAAADADPNVKRITMIIASPGGTVEGLFETLSVISQTRKPITVRASQATSAAYAIAAVSGRISAATPASLFGSIGVVTSLINLEEIVDITNTASPDKRPNLNTEEGRNVIRRELDGIFEVFADAIAQGRGTTMDDVVENYGKGAVMVAKEAKRRKMIDSVPSRVVTGSRAEDDAEPQARVGDLVATAAPEPQPPAPQGQTASAAPGGAEQPPDEDIPMNLAELKEKHPGVYAAAFEEGKAAGATEGTQKERKRCMALRKMAKTTGADDVADTAIENGASLMDDDVQAGFQSAAFKRNAVSARQDDDAPAAAATTNAAPAPEPTEDFGDKVVAALNAKGSF